MRRLALLLALTGLASVAVSAHHSYTAFDRSRSVTVTGAIEQLRFGNPHVVFVLRPADGPALTVTWQSAYQLAGVGINAKMFTIGERLSVTGSPALDASRYELTLIRRVERLADGWTWTIEGGRMSVSGLGR